VERDGESIRLSTTEFDLLAFFARHPGQVLSRETLLSAVWGYEHDPRTNTLGVYVSYLRKKLAVEGRPSPIDTVRSIGYRLRADA
jgi:two-component system response regulator MprA